MRRRDSILSIWAALAGLLIPRAARAHPIARGGYSVTLVDSAGHSLPTFSQGRQRWVLGRWGQRYSVRLTNHTARRVEAVLTIDGRDAISGQLGEYATGRGYVLAPYASITIAGYRRSLDSVAGFRFTSPGRSYSAKLGSPEHNGVIGVAFFGERHRTHAIPHPRRRRRRPVPYPMPGHGPGSREQSGSAQEQSMPEPGSPTDRGRKARKTDERSAGTNADAQRTSRGRPPRGQSRRKTKSGRRLPSPSQDNSSNLGTAYGSERYSAAHYVHFERAHPTRPDQIQSLRYDDAEGLERRGIRPPPRPSPPEPPPPKPLPRPFPQNPRQGFAPPPPRDAD